MYCLVIILAAVGLFAHSSFAAPTLVSSEERGLLDSVGSLVNGVVSEVVSEVVSGVVADATDAAAVFAVILSEVEAVVPIGNKWTTMSRFKIN